MASILIYAGAKSYKSYRVKRANSSTERPAKLKRDRKSISSLVIPTVTSAHFRVIDEKANISDLPPCDETSYGEPPEYTAPQSPGNIGPPSRAPPPAPVMLGITLCESPSTPKTESYGDSGFYFEDCSPSELPGNSPIDSSNKVFEVCGDEGFSEPLSPAPLHVVKRGSSPLLPELTYSSDESEEEIEERHRTTQAMSYLQVPGSAKELMDFKPPPIPPKSPARKLRVASS